MSVKKGLLWSLAVAVLPLLMVACGGAEATPTPGPGEPTPTLDFQATIAAQARAADIGTPTPTPVPPEDRAVVLDFAKRHDGIDRDWERLHTDFDKWREGLIACDANTLQATLREFAARFSAVAEEARRLPRSRPVRELADKLIGAIEGEAAALRLLRDNWRPGDPAVFAAMDLERSAASALQKEVQDELTDLQKRTSIASREIVATYSLAFRGLNTEWDKFHGKYDDFRAAEADLTSADTVLRLSELIDDVSGHRR